MPGHNPCMFFHAAQAATIETIDNEMRPKRAKIRLNLHMAPANNSKRSAHASLLPTGVSAGVLPPLLLAG